MSFWKRERFTESDMASSWIAGFTCAITSENLDKLKTKIKDEALFEAIKRLPQKEKNASDKK